MTALRGLAVWTGPVLVGTLTTRVAAGTPDAPMLVLAAVVAPLVALLQPRGDDAPHVVSAAATSVSAALILAASLLPLGDAALLLGGRRWQGVALAAALVLLPVLLPEVNRWRTAALAVGAAALVVALLMLGAATARAPWDAWRDAAARPALVFSAHSPWVTGGGWFARRTTLAFEEGHRLIAVSPATFRVVEHDGTSDVVRDWRLAAGDPLSVRPGDRVTIESGSRVRFEAGKRVPGAAASGAAWAEGGASSFIGSLAALATLVLGAIGLVPPAARRGFAAPAMLLIVALAATCWGLYAVIAAPEVMLSGSVAEPLLRVPGAVPGARIVIPFVIVALAALFVATAGALRERVSALAGARATWAWLAVVAVAAGASLWPFDPWFLLMAGLGFAAATLAAPRLAGGRTARIAGWPLPVLGALAGGVVFAGAVALGPRLPAAVGIVAEWPVLLAAPAGWLTVKLLR